MNNPVRTPWHLWVIGGVSLLWNSFGAFDFAATVTHFDAWLQNFPPEILDYVYSQPVWMFVLWGIGTWGGAIGSILLLMRKAAAVQVLVASLLAASLSTLAGLVNEVPEAMSNPALTIGIMVCATGLVAYAWWLAREGVLD